VFYTWLLICMFSTSQAEHNYTSLPPNRDTRFLKSQPNWVFPPAFCLQRVKNLFLDALADLQKANISFFKCLSVCQCARMEQLGSQWTDFHEILYLSIFRKYLEVINFSLKYGQNGGCFVNQQTFLIISRSVFFRMRNVSNKSCRENQNKFCV
jgi:hypothetical protein